MAERDANCIWHPFTQAAVDAAPIPVTGGKAAMLYTQDGRSIIDGISSWWVNIHGHAHPHIAEQAYRQLNELEHVLFAGFTHEPAIRLAERLLPLLPGQMQRAFYSDNGSTAVEVGIKMGLQYHWNLSQPKTKILALNNSYHGDTFGAMSISGRSPFNAPFNELLFDVEFVDAPEPGIEEKSLNAVREIVSSNDVAAFIFEPVVQGAGGMKMHSPEVLDQMIGICREHGVLIIADEVMTGFGRTGPLFASSRFENAPDIIALSKGLTGGTLALGMTVCTNRIYNAFCSTDRFKTFFHGHSYTANPVACRIGMASLDLTLDEECERQRKFIGTQHSAFLSEISSHPRVDKPRQAGTILAFDLKPQETTEQTSYFHAERDRIYNHFLDRGILLRPLGNTIYIMPPYCINADQLHEIYAAIRSLLES